MNPIHLRAHAERIRSTARLRLVPQTAAHAKALFAILCDAELHRYTGNNPPVSEVLLRQWFSRLEARQSPDGKEAWLNWVVMVEGSIAIGYVQATVTDNRCYVAWVIGTDWQCKGYATEAILEINHWLSSNGINPILACIHPDNVASQGVARNVGMRITQEVIDGEQLWELNTKTA